MNFKWTADPRNSTLIRPASPGNLCQLVFPHCEISLMELLHSVAQDVLPYMQIQMALASLLIIGAFAVVADFEMIVTYGLWHGFDRRAVVAVMSSAMGGLIVSAVLKYADSVLKGYATSASVILTGVLSALFFGTTLDLHFVLAVINVTCSIALYGTLGQPAPPTASIPPSKEKDVERGARSSGDTEDDACKR